MARARSPEYPSISLKEAIERVKMVYDKDYQNRVPREVIATHMGYKGISGSSLPVLSALVKYGLLEGRADETHVSDLAVGILAHPPGSPSRNAALINAAAFPELFAELDQRFPTGGSEQALRAYLLTNKFIPSAADAAIRAYRDTKEFVAAETGGYTGSLQQGQPEVPTMSAEANSILDQRPSAIKRPMAIRETFALDEGEVTLSYPAELSPDSYQDMADRLEIILRGLKRRTDAEATRRHRDREDIAE